MHITVRSAALPQRSWRSSSPDNQKPEYSVEDLAAMAVWLILLRAKRREPYVCERETHMSNNEAAQLTEADLEAIEARCAGSTPAPWRSYVEGRDHTSGSS